jgi:hypothetical protein
MELAMTIRRSLSAAALCGLLSAGPAGAAGEGEHFILHDLDMSIEEAAAAIRSITEAEDDWLFLAEFGLLGGEVIAQKICYAPIAGDIVAAGMHVMAMMPCGHLAYYVEDDQPTLARLDLGFMTTLDPAPSLERAAEEGGLAFEALIARAFE